MPRKSGNYHYNEEEILQQSKYLPVSKHKILKSYGQNRKETHCQICIFCMKRFLTVECLKVHLRHHKAQMKYLQDESEKARVKMQIENLIRFSNILLLNNIYLKEQIHIKEKQIALLQLLFKSK